MAFSQLDYQMMSRAINLAKKGRFTTAPNPNVGCVIVKDNKIVGEGYHQKAGEPHAEVHALRQAKELAIGATAYVTLEPCSHFGRTPPCAKGLIEAKVAKVICAMQDPNPQVSGNGIQMLREAGIDVEVGLLEADAMALNSGFIKKMKTGLPFVQLKMASSIDGRTALSNGQSKWITGPQARRDVQQYRALCGAVISTSQTVIADDAALNVRWTELPDVVTDNIAKEALRQPQRVIIDRQSNLVDSLKLFKSGKLPLVISQASHPELFDNKLKLKALLRHLASIENINHVWIEAGATFAAAWLEANLVDELIIYQAPKIMGADARALVDLNGIESMSDVIDLTIIDVAMVGTDIKITAKPISKQGV